MASGNGSTWGGGLDGVEMAFEPGTGLGSSHMPGTAHIEIAGGGSRCRLSQHAFQSVSDFGLGRVCSIAADSWKLLHLSEEPLGCAHWSKLGINQMLGILLGQQ